ncbi:MAG: TIM barrel protein, partial [Anaerolineales bacterium]
YLVVIPAPAGRTAPIGTPDTQEAWEAAHRREWELAVDSVRQAARYAAERGVELALEPINRYETYLVTNLAEALAFINEVDMDNLHVHLDTFHMNIEESSPAEAILRAGDQLVNLHVADSNRETPGRGHLDFAGILNALQETGYEGVLALEPVPPGSDPLLVSQFPKNRPLRDIYAKEGIAYLKQIEANL